ncbi:hypothetical protein G6F35_016467 [Rhizopus arrhizus]|nr:hypothetical protein G6F35_016467 [Rhizopus arrhizus]
MFSAPPSARGRPVGAVEAAFRATGQAFIDARVVHRLDRGREPRGHVAPAATMGDRTGVAVHAVGFRLAVGQRGQIDTGRGAGGADGAVAGIDVALAAGAGFELDHLVGGEVPAQQRVDVTVLDAFAASRRYGIRVGRVLAVEVQRIGVGLVEVAVQPE